MSETKPLTPKEFAFVKHLLRGKGKRQAAILAGYSKTSAHSTASELLQRPQIQAELRSWYQKEEDELAIARERIRQRMEAEALADPSLAFKDDWTLKSRDEVPKEVRRMVISARTWDTPEMGKGAAVKFINPKDARKDYLKLFPPPAKNQAASLDQAAAEVEAEMENLLDRINEDDDEAEE